MIATKTERRSLRLWAQCDPVCQGLLRCLNVELEPVPPWLPRDTLPPEHLPAWSKGRHREAAIKRWEDMQAPKPAPVKKDAEVATKPVPKPQAAHVKKEEAKVTKEEKKAQSEQTVAEKEEKVPFQL